MNTSTGRTMIASQMVPAQSPTVANGVGMEMMQEKVLFGETFQCKAENDNDVMIQCIKNI